MLPIIEVMSDKVDERSGRNERGFWSIRRQEVYVNTGKQYPEPFDITLEDGQAPYKPGKYILGLGAFQRGKYGLELVRNLPLISLSDAQKDIAAQSKSSPV